MLLYPPLLRFLFLFSSAVGGDDCVPEVRLADFGSAFRQYRQISTARDYTAAYRCPSHAFLLYLLREGTPPPDRLIFAFFGPLENVAHDACLYYYILASPQKSQATTV